MKAPCLLAVLLCASLAGCASKSLPLGGTRWELGRLHGQPVNSPLGVTLQFDPEGRRISGFTGVNQLSGVYAIADPSLIMFPVLATHAEAPPEEARLEAEVLEVLNEFGSYRITGDILDLFVGGERAARFFAATP